ncbi:MAG: 3-deoxy-7-phosphoheptulonate synthase [Verrucomicrobiales bacterium]|nr:3-deoxy-7-phosphoheptulonate synthase [Verrucomicrobiales bacterium]
MSITTDDIRIENLHQLIAPVVLMEELTLKDNEAQLVRESRAAAENIMLAKDDRLLVVIGPCSIHDPEAALDYARKLKAYADTAKDDLLIIMRVYFEKPRTTVGWKGLINDPHLNGSFDINLGLRTARNLLLNLLELGMPAGTEFLDTISPQFYADLISWGAIGARTTESQIHRELASGLSMPVGFKNGTGGSIQIALDAIQASQQPHHFLSVTKNGTAAVVTTKGNPASHLILRGSSEGPNYDRETIEAVKQRLKKCGLSDRLMVDCSHGNSRKDYTQQAVVADDIASQIADGENAIASVMIESNLVEGNQSLKDLDQLEYGKSVTDACVSWDNSVAILDQLAEAVRLRRKTLLA